MGTKAVVTKKIYCNISERPEADVVQAQTVANFFLAFDQNLAIVPVLNKLDMSSADPDRVAQEMQQVSHLAHCKLDPCSLLVLSVTGCSSISSCQFLVVCLSVV